VHRLCLLSNGCQSGLPVSLRNRLRLRPRVQMPGLQVLQRDAHVLHGGRQASLPVPLRDGLRLWSGLQVPWMHVLQRGRQVLLDGCQEGLQVPVWREMRLWSGLQVPRMHVLQSGRQGLQVHGMPLQQGLGQVLQNGTGRGGQTHLRLGLQMPGLQVL
jgi:hypothetical protein